VKQMRSVFKSASIVLIWLEDNANDNDQAIQEIERIDFVAITIGLEQLLPNDAKVEKLKQRLLSKDALDPIETMIKQIDSDPFRQNNT